MTDDRLTNADYIWNQLDYEHDALIEASAGTGKTYALESIVLKLICDRGYEAKEILLVTFTEKAAGELKDRVRNALQKEGRLPPDFDEMTICTIHSFCQRILGEYAFENGVPMRSEVGGDSKSLAHQAVLDALKDERFRKEYDKTLYETLADVEIGTIADLVKKVHGIVDSSNCAKTCERMAAAIAAKKTKRGNKQIRKCELLLKLVRLAQPRFEALKEQAALLTFDDMVARAAEVVMKEAQTDDEKKAKECLLKSIRERYRVALVDEFQDTDQKQWNIFRTLFSCAANKIENGKPGFLLVVGDPKQAIYSFRGADVQVYCNARGALTADDATGEDGKPKWRKTLDETYRSKKSLISAFNTFFGDDEIGWFKDGAGGAGIAYGNVAYPRKGNGTFDGILEEREPAPVLLLESMPKRIVPSASGRGTSFGNKSRCLPVFMENAAREMRYLNGLVPAYTQKDAKPDDPAPRFRYGDMCVLVDTKNDAAIVRKVLAKHGIPYGQYKQQGLYDSAEAEGVLALLDYLASPSGRGRRAALLISHIFGVHPSALSSRSSAEERTIDAFIERLQEYTRERNWCKLFESVMSDGCTALTHPQGDLCAFNRLRATTRQIFDALLAENGRLAETVEDFATTLRNWRKNDQAAGEEGSLYRKESAADRVQIMTMHASKGLQFPIVFLAYGWGVQLKGGMAEDEQTAALQERRRLLYVALTRAEHRLYLPWSREAWGWTATKKQRDGTEAELAGSGIGSAGSALLSFSANGFLGKAIQVYFRGRHDEAFAPEREYAMDSDQPFPGRAGGTSTRNDSCELEIPCLKGRRVHWDSFSSLQRHGEPAEYETPGTSSDMAVVLAAGEVAHEVEPQNRSARADTLLRRDNVSGNTFHEIMETLCNNDSANGDVDFNTACDIGMDGEDSALMGLIRRTMRRNLLANREKDGDSTEKTLLRMVQNALRTRITIGSESFMLKNIPKRDRLAEVEFVVSENNLLDLPKGREGALNGKIDLFVRKDGKVFILDWKTNSLADYTDESDLAAAMDEADYHLQYRLYSLAAAAWLANSGLTLAGAAYLFVRGGEAGTESGVFAVPFNAASVDEFRKSVSGRLVNQKSCD